MKIYPGLHFGKLNLTIEKPSINQPLSTEIELYGYRIQGETRNRHKAEYNLSEAELQKSEQNSDDEVILNGIRVGRSETIARITREYLNDGIDDQEMKEQLYQWFTTQMQDLIVGKVLNKRIREVDQYEQELSALKPAEALQKFCKYFLLKFKNNKVATYKTGISTDSKIRSAKIGREDYFPVKADTPTSSKIALLPGRVAAITTY